MGSLLNKPRVWRFDCPDHSVHISVILAPLRIRQEMLQSRIVSTLINSTLFAVFQMTINWQTDDHPAWDVGDKYFGKC